MITMGYKGFLTPQLSSWARFGHTTTLSTKTPIFEKNPFSSSFLQHLLFRRIHRVLSSLNRSSCHHGPIDSLRGRSATLITSLRRSLCGTKRAYPLDLFLYGSRCLP